MCCRCNTIREDRLKDIHIGLDIGTTTIKAAAYYSDGQAIKVCEVPNIITRPYQNWCEQGMGDVWQRVCQCLQDLCADLEQENIMTLGVCAQGDGLWMLDEYQQPIEPALLWNDTRAGSMLKESKEQNKFIAHACHTANWPGTAASLFSWVSKYQPDKAATCRHILTCADWVGLNLTGSLATDYSDASIPFMDLGKKQWSKDALAAFNIDANTLPKVQSATTQLGTISAIAASKTGLPEGLPVATGTLDLGAMIVGLGMNKPDQAMMVLGTTAVVNILSNKRPSSDAPNGATVRHPTSDLYIRILAPTTGAAVFDWFTALHPLTLSGVDAKEMAAKLNILAEEVAPGSNGVTFLPYLNGERAPFVAPEAHGSFHGLNGSTTMAEMGRAVMEGVAFSLRHCFDAINGLPNEPVWLTGGGAKNDLWRQIIADVLGVPIFISDTSDQGLWGAACIGMASLNGNDPCQIAKRNEIPYMTTPDMDKHAQYTQAYLHYLAIISASKPIWDLPESNLNLEKLRNHE